MLLLILWFLVTGASGRKFNGAWVNMEGSIAYLTEKDNILTGKYFSRVGDAKGNYTLHGSVYGNNTVWYVVWKNGIMDSKSITTWNGVYDTSSSSINTVWTLTVDEGPGNFWESTKINTDTFARWG